MRILADIVGAAGFAGAVLLIGLGFKEERSLMVKRVTLGERLRYQFDKSMAAGPIALIGWLALISLATILVAGAVLAITRIAPEGSPPIGFVEAVWGALMRSMDAGTCLLYTSPSPRD